MLVPGRPSLEPPTILTTPGGPQALRGLARSGCPRPVSGSPHWQDGSDGPPGGWVQATSPPSRGPRVFWGVPAPGYDSEWSPGGCSESLHALLLQEAKARALGCRPRLVINQPLSRSPQSSGVWTCVTCGHNNAWPHMALPPCDSDLTRVPLHLRECLSATYPPLPGLRGHTVNHFSGFPMLQHEDGAV